MLLDLPESCVTQRWAISLAEQNVGLHNDSNLLDGQTNDQLLRNLTALVLELSFIVEAP